jgi:hypothetical protein
MFYDLLASWQGTPNCVRLPHQRRRAPQAGRRRALEDRHGAPLIRVLLSMHSRDRPGRGGLRGDEALGARRLADAVLNLDPGPLKLFQPLMWA